MAFFYRTMTSDAGAAYRYAGRPEPVIDELAAQADAARESAGSRIGGVVAIKRVFDIAVASVALALLAPVIVIVALVIKLESRGPVFFTQERIGINRRRGERRRAQAHAPLDARSGVDRRKSINPGKPFRIYKFRTMVQDAEKAGPMLARSNDPRVTRVGRVMRKTRVDEIPQFINVIRGDMSIIGPRPERSFFINQVRHDVPEFTTRLMVKPGITGLAQVENGYTQSIDEMKTKLFYDLKYISELSLMQEIKILFKTVQVIVTGKGAC